MNSRLLTGLALAGAALLVPDLPTSVRIAREEPDLHPYLVVSYLLLAFAICAFFMEAD